MQLILLFILRNENEKLGTLNIFWDGKDLLSRLHVAHPVNTIIH